MGCHHVLQLAALQGCGQRRGLRIGEVATVTGDTALEKLRVSRLLEQVQVMVAFKQQDLAIDQTLRHARRHMTQVGQDPQLMLAVSAMQLQRFPRIMGYRKWHDLHLAQVDGLPIGAKAEQFAVIAFAGRAPGALAHPDRDMVAGGDAVSMGDVVMVLVGNEHGVEIVQLQPGQRQPSL
jgi:hypothetical protein